MSNPLESPRIPFCPLRGFGKNALNPLQKTTPSLRGVSARGNDAGGFAGESGRPGGQESRGQVAGDCRKAFFVVMGLPDMAKTI